MRRPPPRRRALRPFEGRVGLVVIAALVLAAMGATAALVLGGGSADGGGQTTPPGPRTAAGKLFSSRALGVAGIRPPGWRLETSRRAVRLRSPGRAGVVAVSTAPASVGARALMGSTLAALTRSYRREKLSRRRRASLGGYAGIAVSGSATNARGVRLELLVSTARGRRRTYLVQAFVAHSAGALRLAEAQVLVDSLELSG